MQESRRPIQELGVSLQRMEGYQIWRAVSNRYLDQLPTYGMIISSWRVHVRKPPNGPSQICGTRGCRGYVYAAGS